jgi:hypothetical protein
MRMAVAVNIFMHNMQIHSRPCPLDGQTFHGDICIHTFTHTHTHTHTRTHIYIHTCTHAHTHTQRGLRSENRLTSCLATQYTHKYIHTYIHSQATMLWHHPNSVWIQIQFEFQFSLNSYSVWVYIHAFMTMLLNLSSDIHTERIIFLTHRKQCTIIDGIYIHTWPWVCSSTGQTIQLNNKLLDEYALTDKHRHTQMTQTQTHTYTDMTMTMLLNWSNYQPDQPAAYTQRIILMTHGKQCTIIDDIYIHTHDHDYALELVKLSDWSANCWMNCFCKRYICSSCCTTNIQESVHVCVYVCIYVCV